MVDGDSLTVADMLLYYAGWRSFVRVSPTIRGAYGKGRFYVIYAKMHHRFARCILAFLMFCCKKITDMI